MNNIGIQLLIVAGVIVWWCLWYAIGTMISQMLEYYFLGFLIFILGGFALPLVIIGLILLF